MVATTKPDLNLLRVLHALLEERSVTRAAGRLGISQPAASLSLRRLRTHFGDELLLRVGNHYELTQLGEILRGQADLALSVSDRLFETKSMFDPATSDRSFTIAMSDYALRVIGPALLDALSDSAPQARLHFRPVTRVVGHEDPAAMRSVDVMVLPHSAAPRRFPHRELYRDEWVCLVETEEELTDTELLRLEWVLGFHDATAGEGVEQRLVQAGVTVNPLAVDSFDILPRFVRAGRRLALVQRRLLDSEALPRGMRIHPCPVELDPIVETLWWHPAHSDDAAHAWFRELVLTAVARTIRSTHPHDQVSVSRPSTSKGSKL